MKNFLLASAAILAVGGASAFAADLPSRVPMPAKAPAYFQTYNWTGVYVGINGGGGWGSDSDNTSGGLVGGTLGYNYQLGQVVFGIEGDIDWSGIKGSETCGGLNCDTRNNWLSTVRGRLGYAGFDRFLPYVTGGVAFGDVKTSVAGFGDSSKTRTGWTLGGGVEYAIAGPWTAKVEYLYVDLGSGDDSAFGSNRDFKTSLVRAGLNYRF